MAAPDAEFDNGVLDVLALVGSSRLDLLKMFLAIDKGKHLGGGGLRLLKVRAMRLDPAPRSPDAPGHLAIDGEAASFGPVEARAHPRAMRVLVP